MCCIHIFTLFTCVILGLEYTKFEWDRLLTIRNAVNISALRFLDNYKTPILVSIITYRDNEVLLKAFNHESKEVLGSIIFANINVQRGLPCMGR